jgi:uncharacterized metal-binding protein YceD (DUF177 family)
MDNVSGFRRLQSLSALPEAGLEVSIEAKPQERAALAGYLEVDAVRAVRAKLTLTRWRAHGVRVAGKVTATVTQTCVVTLDPIETVIATGLDRKFLPGSMLGEEATTQEMLVDPEGEDPPDLLPHALDLGELVAEELLLNIDAYPRKSGLAEPQEEAPMPAPESPFAILKKLT